jgi:hypothetical protein
MLRRPDHWLEMSEIRCGLFLALVVVACGRPESMPGKAPQSQVVWTVDNLGSIGGRPVVVLGDPQVIDDPAGSAVEFDGIDDGLRLPHHPLSGAGEFTAEVIFRPAAGGSPEQRFLHLQEDGSKDRILFEIRITADDRWFLDTYIKSAGEGYTLFAKQHPHPLGPWYHAALVVEGGTMRHYVNGDLEISRAIQYRAQATGRTSIGVRINEVSWFRGAIREARFTPRALSPDEFLQR